MRTMQIPNPKHRVGAATAACFGRDPDPGAPEPMIAAAVDALTEMGNIVSHRCFADPASLTENRVTAYALALMRLRECAGALGFERLMNACDALAVTVSGLIEDRGCACHRKCEALTRFVVHAEAMIKMATDSTTHYAPPIPDIRMTSDRMRVERTARVSM